MIYLRFADVMQVFCFHATLFADGSALILILFSFSSKGVEDFSDPTQTAR